MKTPEDDLPEEYRKNAQALLEMIEERDVYTAALPNLPPETRAEAVSLLAELSRSIDQIEQELSREYERIREEKRIEAEIDKKLAEGEVTQERLYIIIKHTKPHLFEEFHEICVGDLTPEEEQEFYDRIAVREAQELDELIKEKA